VFKILKNLFQINNVWAGKCLANQNGGCSFFNQSKTAKSFSLSETQIRDTSSKGDQKQIDGIILVSKKGNGDVPSQPCLCPH
jgi:hypothetical protein